MELLPGELRRRLPPIRKIHTPADEGQCMIYAKLFTPNTGVTFYVAEGEHRNADYVVWGLIIAPEFKFPLRFQMTIGRLQTEDWLGKEPCQRDDRFQAAKWAEVERTVPNLRAPLTASGKIRNSSKRRR
jgi:hypothetical protein